MASQPLKEPIQPRSTLRVAVIVAAGLSCITLALAAPDVPIADAENDPYVRIGHFHLLPLVAATLAGLVLALAVPTLRRSDAARTLLSGVLLVVGWASLFILAFVVVLFFVRGFVPNDTLAYVFIPPVALYAGLAVVAYVLARVLRSAAMVNYFRSH